MQGTKEERLTIGELARSANVSTRTVRYYEERGVLPPPDRTEGGTRRYRPEWRFYLEGALILKDLGFSLEEIGTLGRLAYGQQVSPRQSEAALKMLDERVAELDHRAEVMRLIQRRVRDVLGGTDRGAVVKSFVDDARKLNHKVS
jgi:DNA-binding transcriptional MerR regulator